MLPRKYKLKEENDFKETFKQGKYFQQQFIKIKILKNDLAINRFGFLIGLKISKRAVQRNKIKRRLEEIIRLKLEEMKPGFDIIVMVNPEIKEKDYQAIKENLASLFKKAKLLP
jgi:ribonuclease P protein component